MAAKAKALADLALVWYADTARGGFYFTAHDHEKLFARAKDGYDGAQPSGNSVALRNLVAGPPPVLPLAYALTGVLGIIGLMWDA